MPLFDELRKNNLNDRESVKRFLKDKDNYKKLGLEEKKLELEEQNRIKSTITEGERFKHNGENPVNPCYAENCVIKFDGELMLKNFDRIKFSNAIIIGDLFIWMLPEGNRFKATSVVIENVVVLGNVRIKMYSGYVEQVYIGASVIDCLCISDDARCDRFTIDEVSVGQISFEDVKIQSLEISDSQIDSVRIKENVYFGRKRLSNSKIDIKRTFDFSQNDFQWKILPKNPYGSNYDETKRVYSAEEKERTFKETFEFLTSFSSGISLEDSASIANEKLIHEKKRIGAYLHKLLDNLLKPRYVILSILYIIVLCTFIYMDESFYFPNMNSGDEPIPLSLSQAFYYSVVTFSTIGYGDYTSCDTLVRIVSSIEGLFGVLGGGALLIALTRTYLDPNK